MPIENYGVLKGKILTGRQERYDNSPHYQILVEGENKTSYRVAVNVMSRTQESEILYLADEQYRNAGIKNIQKLPNGFTRINQNNRELALDYTRGNMIHKHHKLVLTPHDKPGPRNDLNDFIHEYIKNSRQSNDVIYVFGSKFGPEDKADPVFGFYPMLGMHNVHMNQGNDGKWKKDNGIWQDGGILIQKEGRWIAILLAFVTQSWHTDEKGNPK
ncbi:YukJ family protein [Konateibacter massiliensis]|uniref:YukJ family protein n=1 Tax=Konateibacter massiliensis TaxID=2002841 RepID=UPI000C153A73|nr:YukJ family protein [Konateibacter massiliensis]